MTVSDGVEREPRNLRTVIPFRSVAAVFLALIAVGLVAAFVVYRKYVAYEPHAAAHAPRGASLLVRVDLTHVMFYEPARRSILPLADAFSVSAPSRRERLRAHGVDVNANVRELVLALGPAANDWLVVIGGQLAGRDLAGALAAVLREEGREVEARAGGLNVLAGSGIAFAEAPDGVLLVGSSEAQVRGALDPVLDQRLAQGSGGVVVNARLLPSELESVRASFRAGSVVQVDGVAKYRGDAVAAERALRELFSRLAKLDPEFDTPVKQAEFTSEASGTHFRLRLSNAAVERLAVLVAARVTR